MHVYSINAPCCSPIRFIDVKSLKHHIFSLTKNVACKELKRLEDQIFKFITLQRWEPFTFACCAPTYIRGEPFLAKLPSSLSSKLLTAFLWQTPNTSSRSNFHDFMCMKQDTFSLFTTSSTSDRSETWRMKSCHVEPVSNKLNAKLN